MDKLLKDLYWTLVCLVRCFMTPLRQ